ncbi:MAG: C25 family cysteine peptidase [Candidatus Zixiibacteriota bacterium]
MNSANVKSTGKALLFFVTVLSSGIFLGASVSSSQPGLRDGEISVTIPVGQYVIENTTKGQEISVENFGRLLVPGKPDLPSKIFAIAIPPGAKVDAVTFDVGEGIVLPGTYQVPPAPLTRVIGEENPLFYQQDQKKYDNNFESVYGSDEPYPTSVGEAIGNAGFRRYNLVDVRVTPFSYHPQSGQLTYYSQVTANVKYTLPPSLSSGDVVSDNLPREEKTAQEIVFNYGQAQSWYGAPKGGKGLYDFVIITTDALTSSVTPLANWETGKGKSVKVVTVSWISSNYTGYDVAEKIRNFLRDKYPSGQWGIEDVLLVGNHTDVPMRRVYQDEGYGKPETDYYYAELSLPDSLSWDQDKDHQWAENTDPIDFYAEVNVGRIPSSVAATVLHICQKSVAYEQNADPAFKKNILLLGAFFWDDDPNPRTDNAVLMEAKVNQLWMGDWTKTRMYERGYSTYTMNYNLTYNNVKSVWSSNHYAFVNWAGHGSEYGSYIYHSTHEAFVSTSTCPNLNDDYPAICFADACSNFDTDYQGTNLGQGMLQQGAVGFVGATKVAFGCPGWTNQNSGSSQSLDYLFTTKVTSQSLTQGAALQWALTYMYTHGLWSNNRYETAEWGALGGNPDLGMATVITNYPPLIPQQPSGVTVGQPGVEYSFSSTTTDPDGDSLSYLFDWGDGGIGSWLGPYASGQSCTSSHVWSTAGIYRLKVKAKDTFGHESGWSDSLSVTIFTRGDCTADQVVDVGDVLYLVNYLYSGGSAPYPLESGDANCDGMVQASDVVYLVNYLFRGGPAPGCR